MAPKQRQIRMEQRLLTPDVMEQMQARSDEQLENERKFRSVAYSILGARAAERYDAKAARAWFEKAMVASRHPQERAQIRRMADASLALAERRAGDLKVAVEKLGAEAPSSRALFGLRGMGLIAPPRGSSRLVRIRGGLCGWGCSSTRWRAGPPRVAGAGARRQREPGPPAGPELSRSRRARRP